ncbi:MAG: acyl-CoA synthetase [Nevskiaceae bacterium]|nr:MAG: acyl-CoA synthetase [Nevskiaceae bacterium]TAM22272.1 MAG: acyl-CoA synthetase [Nevskiaceae bacterium]
MSPPAPAVIRGLDDILAIEQEPLASRQPPESTFALIREAARRHGDAPALSFFLDGLHPERASRYSYRQLHAQVCRCANALDELGLTPDDVVAYILPNLPETHFVLWGGEATGIVFAINPLLDAGQIVELLKAAAVKVLVTLAPVPSSDLWPKIAPELHRVPGLETVLLVDISEHLPFSKRVMLNAWRLQQGRVRHSGGAQVLDFHKLLSRQSGRGLDSGRWIRSDAVSSYFCTGGTTGAPKIAMRSHGNEVANTLQLASINPGSFLPGKTLFCGLPLFHVNAALVTGLAAFSAGGHVVLGTPQGYRGEGVVRNFWGIVEHYRINFFSGVPTVYSALLQVPIGAHDISSLEYGLCGAAPMPVEVCKSFEQRTGIRILEGYGLTEATCVSACNPPEGARHVGSIGLRLPWQPMRALRLDEDGRYQRDCEVDEVGVIAIRGPNVFPGYLDPAHNKGLWIETPNGARWLNTGDLGRQDAEGNFWLTGRKKELIIRGGHNIDPASIEEPMHAHPAVALCAAVGRPDAHAGELPVAYVQLKPGHQVGEAELMEHAQAHIAERAALPKRIQVIEAMPVTPVGKIYKLELRQREAREVTEALLAELGGWPGASVSVSQDSRRGLLVVVRHRASAAEVETLRARLGAYTFAFELERL